MTRLQRVTRGIQATPTWRTTLQELEENHRLVRGNDGLSCPICLKSLTLHDAQRDHVPPKRIGGRIRVPVCRPCNSQAGHVLESHLDKYVRRKKFEAQYGGEPAVLRVSGRRARTALSVDESTIKLVARQDYPAAAKASRAVESAFDMIIKDQQWDGIEFTISSDRLLTFSERRLNLAWVKAAYLAVFWFLGYGAIMAPAYDAVRQQLREPDKEILPLFVGGRRKTTDDRLVMLWYVHDPWKVFLVYFEGFPPVRDAAVLMPAPKDYDLTAYTRAVASMGPGVKLTATGFPPDQRERGNDGLTLVSEDTGLEHLVY